MVIVVLDRGEMKLGKVGACRPHRVFPSSRRITQQVLDWFTNPHPQTAITTPRQHP
ncbi:hypothetical protein BZL30_4508 [Mycobacterium kansasii]|uniref:Uncharacterized protein n=1 Tax=Mycobacterium kansasii TaxID=1768 RepID=A0A1V3WCQ4_MYCKA|nr:hypothetical protein BZL29_8141 [Mycobacterium kansasii]OOK73518.1 hypothetical protein BZL30_4508 [Mycobacterium kansasii]